MLVKGDLVNKATMITKIGRYSLALCVLFSLSMQGMAIYNVSFYLLLVSLAVFLWQSRPFFQLPDKNIFYGYAIFCISLLMAGVLNGEMDNVKELVRVVYKTMPFLLFYFGYMCFGCKELVYKSFLAALLVNASIVLYWYLQVWDRHSRLSIIDNPNHLVDYLSISFIFGLLAIYEYRRSKLVVLMGIASLVILLLGMWWTGSRGGMAGLLAGVALTFFCRILRKKKACFRRPLLVSVITMIAGCLLICGLTAFLFSRNTSDTGRLYIYKASVQMFMNHPLQGVGVNNYSKEYVNYIQPDWTIHKVFQHAHNDFLQLLATTGIIGATGFVIFSFVFLWTLLKRVLFYPEKAIYLAMLCTFIAMYLHGLVDIVMLYRYDTRIVFGMLGITLAIGDKKEDNDELH